MFSTVLKEITDYLDRRFVFTFLFPSLLFWGGLLGVYTWENDPVTLWANWDAQTATAKWIQVVVALAWVTFFAHLVANQFTWLTRQFEGYWDWIPFSIGEWLARLRKNHYAGVLDAFDKQKDRRGYEHIYYGYPLPDEKEHLMPTRLGNILKNSELYSFRRYRADAVLLWPRLYAILPKEYADQLSDAKASLDLMLVLSALNGLFAIVTGGYLLIIGSVWWFFPVCLLGGLYLSWLTYLSALQAAIPYAQLIKSAFDLYRGDLLDKLGYEHPKTLSDEIKLWDNLCKLIYRGGVEDESILRYRDASSNQEKPTPPSTNQESS